MNAEIPAGSPFVCDKNSSQTSELTRWYDVMAEPSPTYLAGHAVAAFRALENGPVEPLAVAVRFDWRDVDRQERLKGQTVMLVTPEVSTETDLPVGWQDWAVLENVDHIDADAVEAVVGRGLIAAPPRSGYVAYWRSLQVIVGRYAVGEAVGSDEVVVYDQGAPPLRLPAVNRDGWAWVVGRSVRQPILPVDIAFQSGLADPYVLTASFTRFWSFFALDRAPGEQWVADFARRTRETIDWDDVVHGQGKPYVATPPSTSQTSVASSTFPECSTGLEALPVYERQTSGEYFETEFADCWPEFWWGFPGFALQRLGIEIPEEEPLALFRTESGSAALRAEVSTYLDAAPMAVVGMVPEQKCEFCDVMIHIASQQSDGVWLWPSDLGHRVAEHGFYVPNRFVDHIRAQGRPPADLLGVDVDRLPWPNRAE